MSQVQPRSGHAAADPDRRVVVLMVDDDQLILESLGFIFDYLGCTAVAAATGEAGVAHLEAGLRPDLVILDMDMPGLGGARTLPLIRELRPELPVVIATGRLNEEAVELSQQYSGVSLMPKPYGLVAIRQLLAAL